MNMLVHKGTRVHPPAKEKVFACVQRLSTNVCKNVRVSIHCLFSKDPLSLPRCACVCVCLGITR